MFWSKIWFFLVAIAAATALTIALVLPRPAAREAERDHVRHLADACVVANILLTDNARDRIGFTGDFARAEGIDKALDAARGAAEISGDINKAGRDAAARLLEDIKGTPPSFVYLVDARGRVVAREGAQADRTRFGDSMINYPVVQDALSGYLRDDVWLHNRGLYLVSASPVINRSAQGGDTYAGAVVLGYIIDKTFATDFAKNLKFSIGFYAGDESMASSSTVQLHKDVVTEYGKLRDGFAKDRIEDCATNKPFTVSTDAGTFSVLIARLPGEASAEGNAFYAVFAERPKAIGFMGTFGALKKEDLSFGKFPWLPLGLAFLVIVGVGMALMILETDRPLRKLVNDAVALAKGERPRLQEDAHRGKFGSIARSVNIQLDKQEREAKAAKKDLDQLLGPADAALAAGAAVSPLPAMAPGALAAPEFRPPPPSEFRFGGAPAPAKAPPAPATLGADFDLDLPPPPARDAPLASATNQRVPPPPITIPGAKPAPPPRPPAPPPPPPLPPRPATPPRPADNDLLGMGDDDLEALPTVPADIPLRRPGDFDAPTVVADPSQELLAAAGGDDDMVFRKVFDEFITMKKKCGEPTASLTFDKFRTKLEKNRAELIAKHGCKQVRFQVYIKDGKAALKATPVKG